MRFMPRSPSKRILWELQRTLIVDSGGRRCAGAWPLRSVQHIPVHIAPATVSARDASVLCRTLVGVLNRKSKKLKLCPAAASQPTRLEVRLSDVQYGALPHEAASLEDYQQRLALNNQLVQAFGSSRRCDPLPASLPATAAHDVYDV